MKTACSIIAVTIAGASLSAVPRQTPAAAPSIQAQLDEANRDFTYKGKPINPLAIQELGMWLSDTLPGPVAIDLAGTYETNRYFGEYTREKDGTVTINLNTTNPTASKDDNKGWFSYRRIGTLPNRIQVLETAASGGGSGIFMSLLLVQFAADYEYGEDGARRDRVVIRRTGEFGLGDRYQGTVTIKGNTIEIGADARVGGEKPRTIRIQ